jgi:putative ATP-dependent endonuclease of OLD family
MHVERLIIRNFRGIATADIRLQAGLNVLVGRNGSGKSTVLQALRILLDATLGRQARALNEGDIYGNEKLAGPANVVIAARFAGFGDTERDKRLRFRFKAEDENPSAWLVYRFRPKLEAQNQVKDGERKPSDLTLNDYEPERLVGITDDPHAIAWDADPSNAEALTDTDVATIFVEEIQALRNVVDELRRQRTSPLADLLGTVDVPSAEQERVEQAYAEAQKTVEGVVALAEVATAIGTSYELLTVESRIRIRLGLTPPGYSAIIQDLGVFLTDDQVADMELRRNGLGFNNLLYIAMLLENFRYCAQSRVSRSRQ